jgi:type II secretory ATPase GspE/PulE/Tfp pilus assembly ATPase PilB-like protein
VRTSEDGYPSGGGYKGRVSLHVLMATSEELIRTINAESEAVELKRDAMRNGIGKTPKAVC